MRVWSGITTITHCRPTHGTAGMSHRTLAITRHQEDIKVRFKLFAEVILRQQKKKN